MKKIIGVDSGKYETKVLVHTSLDESRFSFRTKMDKTEENQSNTSDSCVLEYDGKKVLLGKEAENIDYNASKAKEIHKLSTYAAIAQSVEYGERIYLSCGCPLSVFNNKKERDAYKDFMWDKGEIKLRINEIEKKFTIEDIIVCPEGSGIIYNNPKKYKDELIAVIDIGGLNTNCCVYDKLSPVKSSSFTTNLGANIMRNELKQTLNSKFRDVHLQDWQMENVINKGYIKSNKEESAIIISEAIQAHVKKILDECTKKGWDIKNIDFAFTGGGSLQFKNDILKVIPDAEIGTEAKWENVSGFTKAGIAYANRA